MDLIEAINSKLPEGRRPITSLSHPGEINRQIAEVLAETVSSAEVGETIKSLLTADKRTKEGGYEPDWRKALARVSGRPARPTPRDPPDDHHALRGGEHEDAGESGDARGDEKLDCEG
jgi:hypothetical protein